MKAKPNLIPSESSEASDSFLSTITDISNTHTCSEISMKVKSVYLRLILFLTILYGSANASPQDLLKDGCQLDFSLSSDYNKDEIPTSNTRDGFQISAKLDILDIQVIKIFSS